MSINPNSVLDEAASGALTLVCGKHSYVAARKKAHATIAVPPESRGCKECWMVYYTTDLALTPPGKRQERLDELQEVIMHAVEYEKTGKFGKDFELYEPGDSRFGVEYEKDGLPEEGEKN